MHTQLYFYYNEPKECYPSLISRIFQGYPKLLGPASKILRQKAHQGGYRDQPKLQGHLNLEVLKRRERKFGSGSKASSSEKFVRKPVLTN